MAIRTVSVVRTLAGVALLVGGVFAQSARAQTIIDEWSSITAPPPPPLKAVTIDKGTTRNAPIISGATTLTTLEQLAF